MIYYRYLENGLEKNGEIENSGIGKLDGIKLLTPVKPSKIIAIGLNYMDHIKEFGDRPIPKNPTIFVKFPHTVIGPLDTIKLPKDYQRVDYEAELAIVISKYCYQVSKEEAKDYILGATCLNDVTERVVQKADGQWIRGKNFPTFCPIGPYIVSDIDYNNLGIKAILNDEVKQDANTNLFIWNVYDLISFVSQSIPLEEGDVITTGTPMGVSGMKDKDKIVVEIEGIGKLINFVSK